MYTLILKSRITLTATAATAALLLAACASIGHPEGGPRDMTPPVFTGSNPAPGTVNFTGNRITLDFNENIQLDDPANKIIISPPQQRPPAVTSNGRRVTVEFRDTLLPSTTYTIDFADAIRDLNEGNILDGFATNFSTGAARDSMSIAGMVFEARNLEPAQGMLVGVYPVAEWTDTTLSTIRPRRVTKTNALGQFTIRNLAPGEYRVAAFNDVDRNYIWGRTEDIALYPVSVITGIETVVLPDSLRTNAGDTTALRYTPDNLLLTWSNDGYIPSYLVKYERPTRERLELIFSTPAKTLAEITDAGGRDMHQWAAAEASIGLDTVTLWLRDSTMIKADTLNLSVKYLHTDSLERLQPYTEQLAFTFRTRRSKNDNGEKDNVESTTKENVATAINLNMKTTGTLDTRSALQWESPTPITALNSEGIHLEVKQDTLWMPVDTPPDFLPPGPWQPRQRVWKPQEWTPGAHYRLTIDSLAVTDIHGRGNNPLKQEFSIKNLDEYGALYVNIHGLDSLPAVLEVLQGDNTARTAPVINGLATLTDLNPGTYYIRLYIDANANGQWDSGSPMTGTQPEEVSYYNKKINLRKNWDIEIDWDINALAVDEQKPEEIKKNKPPRPKWETEAEQRPLRDEPDDQWEQMTRDPFFR